MEVVRGVQKVPGLGGGDRSLAGWVADAFQAVRARQRRGRMREVQQMQVIEMMPLGGRRQLVLVRCGAERYLVGCGADEVQTIVRVGVPVGATVPAAEKLAEDA